MRRLISAVRVHLHKIRIRSAEQHVADRQRMLSDMISARDLMESEIAEATRQLVKANRHLDNIRGTHQERHHG